MSQQQINITSQSIIDIITGTMQIVQGVHKIINACNITFKPCNNQVHHTPPQPNYQSFDAAFATFISKYQTNNNDQNF